MNKETNMRNLNFNTPEEAFIWLEDYIHNIINDWCDDNYRFCYIGDKETESIYDTSLSKGGDGFMDIQVIIDGKRAVIGCNYGH